MMEHIQSGDISSNASKLNSPVFVTEDVLLEMDFSIDLKHLSYIAFSFQLISTSLGTILLGYVSFDSMSISNTCNFFLLAFSASFQ